MTGILSRLRGLRKSSDIQDTIPSIEREIETARTELADLAATRGAAFFDKSEAEQAKLDQQVVDAERRCHNLGLALAEARKRQAAAAEAERIAELEVRVRDYPARVERARQAFKEIVDAKVKQGHEIGHHKAEMARLEAAEAAAKAALKKLAIEVDDINSEAGRMGRPDLVRPELPAFATKTTWEDQLSHEEQQRQLLGRAGDVRSVVSLRTVANA